MSKTHETIDENGLLQRLGAQPVAGRHRLWITIIDGRPPRYSPQEVHRMLEATRGTWGRWKTLEDIDLESDRMRAEWDQDAGSI